MTLAARLEAARGCARDVFTGSEGATYTSAKPLSSTSYLIAMLPRTGSTALCSLLAQTDQLGYPDEYLNPRGPMQHWLKRYPSTDLVEYFDIIRRERASTNGVFGIKATYDDFRPIVEVGAVRAVLGDIGVIYLTRDDLIAQAISEYIAEESGVWHRDTAGNAVQSQVVSGPEEVQYDESRLLDILDRFISMQMQWERFFALYSVRPLRISYEQFCEDAGHIVAEVASHVGVSLTGDADAKQAATSKLADERSVEWGARLRANYIL